MANEQGLLSAEDIMRMQNLLTQIPQAPPANVKLPAPSSGYGGPIPEVSVQGGLHPQFSGGISLPTPIGDVNARGSYAKPQEWRATFELRRQF